MMIALNQLIKRNDNLIEKFKRENNEEKIEKHKLIKNMLEMPNFQNMASIETVYQILFDLGFEREDYKTIYLRLINNQ